jgi:uncharacterized protein involved in exopolysaccharide biosynthesis/Mrp family chromosome partitioning ATPase
MPAYDEPVGSADSLDFHRVASMLLARAWLIILCLILSGGVTFLYLYRAVPRYEATAAIEYQTDQLKILDVPGLLPDNPVGQSLEPKLRQIKRLLSHPEVLRRVVETNKLTTDPRFMALPPDARLSRQDAAFRLQGLFSVTIPKNDNLLLVTVEHPHAGMAAELANSLATELVNWTDEQKMSAIRRAADQLKDIMGTLKEQWLTNQAQLKPMREEAIILSQQLQEVLTDKQRLYESLLGLSLQQIALQAAFNQAQREGTNIEALLRIDLVRNDATVSQLKAELMQRESQFRALKQRVKQKHPAYAQAESELAAVQQRWEDAVRTAAQGIKLSLEQVRSQEEALRNQYQAVNRQAEQLRQKLGLNTNDLPARELELERSIGDRVMQRLKEASITTDLFSNPITVAETAMVPLKPTKPDKVKVSLLGLLAGLALGVGLAVLLGLVDTSLKSLEETEQFLSFPVLSAVPRIAHLEAGQSQIIMSDEANFAGAEAFRSLRTSIAVLNKDKSIKTVLFTSSVPDEGKTFCALNFAVSLAQQGHRTLLVECDLRRPMVGQALPGIRDDHPGVTDYLRLQATGPIGRSQEPASRGGAGLSFAELRRKQEGGGGHAAGSTATLEAKAEAEPRLALTELVQKTSVDNLWFLSAGSPSHNSTELLGQQGAVSALMNEAFRKYDRVVVDSAPVLGVSDTLLLATQVQAVCLVIRAHRTARKAIQRATDVLHRAEVPLLGVILNGLAASRSDYYNDYYHYDDYRAKPPAKT